MATTARPSRGVAVYALAAFGAHLSYTPLLALLLPRRIVAIAPDHAAAATSLVMLTGAVTASLAHILAGRISDRWRLRHGNRRAPIALGLCLTMFALAGLGLAHTVGAIAVGLVAFQMAVNLLLAPLGALLVDHFADQVKGRMAALVNLAMPLAALGTGTAALLFPLDGVAPFVAVALVVGGSVAPLIVFWPFTNAIAMEQRAAPAPAARPSAGIDLVLVGLARMLMQGGAAFTMTYFYVLLARHPARVGVMPGHSVDLLYGRLVVTTTVVILAATVLVGRWSDRRGRRRAPMIVGALVAATALALMQATSVWAVLAGYGLFQLGLIAYLALDTALVAQLLRASTRPGEMLGYINLSNTLPSIAVPAIVLGLAGGTDAGLWEGGFAAAAVSCLLAAGLIARIRAVA